MPRFEFLWFANRGVKPLLQGSVGTEDAEVVPPLESWREGVTEENALMRIRPRDGDEGLAASAR